MKATITKCIICNNPLYHKHNEKVERNLIAHQRCISLVRRLRKHLDGNANMNHFSQRCSVYEIPPTQKALIIARIIES